MRDLLSCYSVLLSRSPGWHGSSHQKLSELRINEPSISQAITLTDNKNKWNKTAHETKLEIKNLKVFWGLRHLESCHRKIKEQNPGEVLPRLLSLSSRLSLANLILSSVFRKPSTSETKRMVWIYFGVLNKTALGVKKAGGMKQILDLLCLPAWVLVRLAAKCDGDACPLMWSFFSVVDGAEVRLRWWWAGKKGKSVQSFV